MRQCEGGTSQCLTRLAAGIGDLSIVKADHGGGRTARVLSDGGKMGRSSMMIKQALPPAEVGTKVRISGIGKRRGAKKLDLTAKRTRCLEVRASTMYS